MFVFDKSIRHVDAPPERVISIITSLNSPDIITENIKQPEPTQAYICAVQVPGGKFQMYVYLYHQNTNTPGLFLWGGDPIVKETFPDVEAQALEFTESMGFLMDNAHYRKKPPEERQQFYDSLPVFKADLSGYARAQEAKEDPSLVDLTEQMEEVEIEDAAPAEEIEEVEAIEEVETVEEVEAVEAAESEGEGIEIDIEEAPPPAAAPPIRGKPAEEVIAAGDAVDEGHVDIDTDDPFGELVVEEAPVPEAQQVSVDGLDDLEAMAGSAESADATPFADEDTGKLRQELDSTIDDLMIDDEPPPAQETAAVEPESEPEVEIEAPPPPPPPPAAKPAPKPMVVSAPRPVTPPPAPSAAQAAPSLEEELLADAAPPSAPTVPAVPALSEEQIRDRLEKIGRLLSTW